MASPAAAKPMQNTDVLSWLDVDAPLVVAVRPAWFHELSELVSGPIGSAVPGLRHRIVRGIDAVSSVLGFDAGEPRAWRAAGLAPNEFVGVSVGAIKASGARAVSKELFRLMNWTSKAMSRIDRAYWRHRLVVRVRGMKAVRKAVWRAISNRSTLHRVVAKNAPAIAMTVGARASKAARTIHDLRKRGVLAIGWLADVDGLIAIRLDRRHRLLVIDVVRSFGGLPHGWPRDRPELSRLWARHPGARPDAPRRALFEGADINAWIDPVALADFAQAASHAGGLRALASFRGSGRERSALRNRTAAAARHCADLRTLGTAGVLGDARVTMAISNDGIDGRVRWTLRDPKLRGVLATSDDGLMSASPPGEVIASAVLMLRSMAKLQSLVRPTVAASFDTLSKATAGCPMGGSAVAGMFGWPYLAALALEEASMKVLAVGDIVAGARNAAIFVRTGPKPQTAVALTTARKAELRARKLTEVRVGNSTTRTVAKTPITEWVSSEVAVAAWHLRGQRPAFAVASTSESVHWLVSRAESVAPLEVAPLEVAPLEVAPLEVAPLEVAPLEVAPVAMLRIDMPRAFRRLVALAPNAAPTLKGLAARTGALAAFLTVDSKAVRSRWSLEFR